MTASFGNDPYVITATYDITSATSFSTNLFRIEVPEFRNDTIVEGDLIFTTATDVLNDPSVDYVTHDGDYIFTPQHTSLVLHKLVSRSLITLKMLITKIFQT